MITLLKLGGSLITDKSTPKSFRESTMARLATEIKAALDMSPVLQLVIGHGSGSFGHVEAHRFGIMQGVDSTEAWYGFARVATIAAELNFLVTQELAAVDIPVFRVQPSASAVAENGYLQSMNLLPIRQAVEHRIVPLVYGDVCLDKTRGGTIISTEMILSYLGANLEVSRIILAGEVDGVINREGCVIDTITPQNFPVIEAALGGSSGTDVTGGMLTKVLDMVNLVERNPQIVVHIVNGHHPDMVKRVLCGDSVGGTRIISDHDM